MTLAETTLARDMREAMRVKLESALADMKKRYPMLPPHRVSLEAGMVALSWGWTLTDQAVAARKLKEGKNGR